MAVAGRVAIVPKGEYSDSANYTRLDLVSYNNNIYIAKRDVTGITPTDGEDWMLCIKSENAGIQEKISAIEVPEFEEATERTNIESGDNHATLWGKVKKFFSDLKMVAFTGSYNDLSDKPKASDVGALSSETKYAASDTVGGSALTIYMPRVNKDANWKPDIKTGTWEEYNSASVNTPSGNWYHIFTGQVEA